MGRRRRGGRGEIPHEKDGDVRLKIRLTTKVDQSGRAKLFLRKPQKTCMPERPLRKGGGGAVGGTRRDGKGREENTMREAASFSIPPVRHAIKDPHQSKFITIDFVSFLFSSTVCFFIQMSFVIISFFLSDFIIDNFKIFGTILR